MTLIVEDGSKLPDAESYISVDECTAYHVKRGNTVWGDMSLQEMEEALVRATDFMRARYRGKWKGHVATYEQGLDWPRMGVKVTDGILASGPYPYVTAYRRPYLPPQILPDNVIPKEVKNACAELAFRAAQGPLIIDETRQPIRETVGPITVQYSEYTSQQVSYPMIDDMLRPFLTTGGNSSVKLTRV